MSIGRPPRKPSRSWQRMIMHVELGGAFQARHLEVPLAAATAFDIDDSAGGAARGLAAGGFDSGPVVRDGTVLGSVERARAEAAAADSSLREVMTPLTEALLVSADTPIGDLFGWLAERPFLFVLDGHDISGFVTIADLNKQPSRAYLYLVIAGLEIALADLVRWRHGTDQRPLLDLLGKRDQDAIKSRVGSDRDAGADADLISYMGFKQLLRIVEKDRALRRELGGHSAHGWRSVTWPLSELRNDVMHPVSSFVSTREDAAELARAVTSAHVLVEEAVSVLRRRYADPEPGE